MTSNTTLHSVNWICTTQHDHWVNKGIVPTVAAHTKQKDVVVDDSQLFQKIHGWGGCFNERGWEALLHLSAEHRNQVVSMLFSEDNGCGFTFCRMPIGASDYAITPYTLSEVPGDYEMTNFSLTQDRKYLIPFIKAAQHFSPHLQFFASPWTAPSWLKNSNILGGGTLKTDPVSLTAYARYFVKFVQEYKAEGIDIDAIHVQNEPDNDTSGGYPSCVVVPEVMRDFIKKYLGPQFEQNNITAHIWIGTVRDATYTYEKTIMEDADARRYVAGIGYQYNGLQSIDRFKTDYPTLPIIQTETQCREHNNSWMDGFQDFGPEEGYGGMVDWLRKGVNAYTQWNMILDQTGANTHGWQQNSMITIDTTSKSVICNPQYYAVRHLAQYVRPGAHRIGVSTQNPLDALAFKNADSSIVVALRNRDTAPVRSVTMQFGQEMVVADIPGLSINTFVARPD